MKMNSMDIKNSLSSLADLEEQKEALNDVIHSIDLEIESLSESHDFSLPERIEPPRPTPFMVKPDYEETSFDVYMMRYHPLRTMGPVILVFLVSVIWITRLGTVFNPRLNKYLIFSAAVFWGIILSFVSFLIKLVVEHYVTDKYYKEEWRRYCHREKRKAYELARKEAARLHCTNWADYQVEKEACDLLYKDRLDALEDELEQELCQIIKNKIKIINLNEMKEKISGIRNEIIKELQEGYDLLNIPEKYRNSTAIHYLANNTTLSLEEGCEKYDIFCNSMESEQLRTEIKKNVSKLTEQAMNEILQAAKNSVPAELRNATHAFFVEDDENKKTINIR